MTHKELLKQFACNDIRFVLVGGLAMRIYNSPRVTHDMDLAVRTVDLDTIIDLMYHHLYYLITNIDDAYVSLKLDPEAAKQWVEHTKSGSLSFLQFYSDPVRESVEMEKVDASSQVDILVELGIPIMRLLERANTIRLEDVSFHVASVEDLITLKKQRSDKSPADEDDIRFLQNLLDES
jgi:predicted nucleotidyltransferase